MSIYKLRSALYTMRTTSYNAQLMDQSMKLSKSQAALPFPVVLALRKLGSDVALARKMRSMTQAVMAERAMVSRNTLARVEKGDAGVSLGTYASVLFVLGMADRLGDLLANDAVTQEGLERIIPKRARARRDVAGSGHDPA
jgi:DNA-binding XRE family transcriptional regulator